MTAKRFIAYIVCRSFTIKPTFQESLVVVPLSYGERVSKIKLRAAAKKFLLARGADEVQVVHVSTVSLTTYNQTFTYEGVNNA